MKLTTESGLMFELTHAFEVTVMDDLKDYFDGMYFAN